MHRIRILGAATLMIVAHSLPWLHTGAFGFRLSRPDPSSGTIADGGAAHLSIRADLSSIARCGVQNGGISCADGLCCSEAGFCGTGRAFCDAPTCQFQYGPACDANALPAGPYTSSVPRPRFGSVGYGAMSVAGCRKTGTVAMTYDDGPYIYTTNLLDVLAAANAKATFFITGNNYGKKGIDTATTIWPEVVRRMHRDGHQIGSHTWSHQNLDQISSAQRTDQMIKNEMALRNVLGFFPTYMRPPYNACKAETGCRNDMGKLGYHIVEYNVDTHDYLNTTPDLIQKSKDVVMAAFAKSNPATQNYIIYAHDTHQQTVTNLTSFIISTVQQKGFKMVTVGECLSEPVTQWYRNSTTGGPIQIRTPRTTLNMAAVDRDVNHALAQSPDQRHGRRQVL